MSDSVLELTDRDFGLFRQLMLKEAGVSLTEAKRPLIIGRLSSRLRQLGLADFAAYYRYVTQGQDAEEWQRMIDLLTTHETYFFREEQHFHWLKRWAAAREVDAPMIWSAACSSGEEVYTIAMVLAEVLGLLSEWRVVGTDISSKVVATAQKGHYDESKLRGLPEYYKKKYCLKGTGSHAGTFLIDKKLREHTRFQVYNLINPQAWSERFDVVFLRNVMIYFDAPTKRQVVQQVSRQMKPRGTLIVGHSESLNGLMTGLRPLQPTIYVQE